MFRKGFTMIEILIAMFLLATGVVAISGVSLLATRTTLQVEKSVVAQAIANEQIEKIHAQQYDTVGNLPTGANLISGSVEGSSIRYTESFVQNTQNYIITTDVTAVDDLANGPISGTVTFGNADYKSVRVQVDPAVSSGSSSATSASTTISNWPPKSCVPGTANACPAPIAPTLPATFKFNNALEMRSLINSTGLYTTIPSYYSYQTYPRNNAETRQKICDLKGYFTASSPSTDGFGSCSDNGIAEWDVGQNNFIVKSSCDVGGTYLDKLTCSSPKPIPMCTASLPCPASGQCTDAYTSRGYTPLKTQYAAICKSNLDCNTGYACNIGSGVCEVNALERYELVTTGDPKKSGQTANCQTVVPNPVKYGTGWVFQERKAFAQNRDICLWKKPATSINEYKLAQGNGLSCSATMSGDASFKLKSSGCVTKHIASTILNCPNETSGVSSSADYCLYEKQNGVEYSGAVVTLESTSGTPQANCTANTIPEGAYSDGGNACVLKSGTKCTNSLCLWQSAAVCPL